MNLFQGGNTALHLACSTGRIEVVKYLLEVGAKLDTPNEVSSQKITLFYSSLQLNLSCRKETLLFIWHAKMEEWKLPDC